MKKTLLATTLLVATAGLAAAEVTVGGSGRFGIVYDGDDSIVDTRLTFNIDGKMETDGGVTFGGRIRIRHDDGRISDAYYVPGPWFGVSGTEGGARLSAAMLYMETGGLRVEVGNANGAYDSAGLIWNSEIGYTYSSYGDPNTPYWAAFSSGPYQMTCLGVFGLCGGQTPDAMGIFVSYSMDSLTVRASYHDVDQTDYWPVLGDQTETSLSLDWSSNGFSVSAATVSNYAGNHHFLGAAYAIGDATNVGVNFFTGDSAPDLITLYANHSLGNGLTIAGYVADMDGASDTAFGIGASYDLGGGASIAGAYHDAGSSSMADLGVNFSF